MNSSKIFHSQTQNDPSDPENWQKELACGISDIAILYQMLGLSLPDDVHTPKKFPLKVPTAFVAKMQYGNENDPLLRQILPSSQEQQLIDGYTTDPLAENHHNPIKGLLHKYKNRVLLTVTGACSVHCRYCFRQHFDYSANIPTKTVWDEIINYITNHQELTEVLLSGGDPLSVSNRKLTDWFGTLSNIAHINTIRLHTRLPVVLPNRIDDALLDLLTHTNKSVVMVLHINHPNEIDDALKEKCRLLRQAGVTLLNQTVLLKGINDDVQTLCKLSHTLFEAGILPYYLHILDKVQGAAHFDISIEQAVDLYWQLLENLSGYLVPKLVQELPNRPYKTPVNIHQSRLT